MKIFDCPYLDGIVELNAERETHIVSNHPDLLPEYANQIAETLKDPDEVRSSNRFGNARMFCRWFESVRMGKFIIAVVISEGETSNRHWIVTAYISRKLAHGAIEWKKD
jgi:hypothetical protein